MPLRRTSLRIAARTWPASRCPKRSSSGSCRRLPQERSRNSSCARRPARPARSTCRPENARMLSPRIAHVLQNPGGFTWCVLRQFKKNQGLLLAGAVAYYALLSVVPLLILVVIALSHLVDQGLLLTTLGRYLEWLV